ncbi:hypothetical protein FRC06_001275 [Ceratobasidium sp. 370]|nr:hypothetical protein FRC06_001275 [Ceratobasidium sp. 370]
MIASLAAVSNALGLASSAAWLGAQFPQLWTNYKLQSADGLALPFLANWLAGDTTNLLGCILTNQLPFQTYLAVYFVWVDFCLLAQYLYYESYKRALPKQKLEISTATIGPIAPLTASPTAAYHPAASTSSLPGPGPNRSRLRARSYSRQPLPLSDDFNDEAGGGELPAMTESFHSEHPRGASLVTGQRGRPFERPEHETGPVEERRRRVSQTSGRGASLVFLAVFGLWGIGFGGSSGSVGGVESRVGKVGKVIGRPEAYIQNTIWKNYTRQSVDGLSISLFVFAFLGNFFYVASILTSSRMVGSPAQRIQYVKDSLPYLLGSGGTFVFDMTIIIQSFVYRGLRPVTAATAGQPRRRYTAVILATEEDPLLGRPHRRSQSFARRSPSVVRGRASLERYNRTRASLDRPARARASLERGYSATQTTGAQGQTGV